MKKLLAIALVLMLMLALTVPVFAANQDGNSQGGKTSTTSQNSQGGNSQGQNNNDQGGKKTAKIEVEVEEPKCEHDGLTVEAVITAATCVSEGVMGIYCVCGELLDTDVIAIDPDNHNLDYIALAPGYGDGYVWAECLDCGIVGVFYSYILWIANGGNDFLAVEEECDHVWVAVALAPGYGDGWVWWSACETCGAVHDPIVGYDYDAWVALGGYAF